MANIKSSVALLLTVADLMGTLSLFILSIYCMDYRYTRRLSQVNPIHNNLRGSKRRIINPNIVVESFKNKIIYNPSKYNEDEFVLPNNQLLQQPYPKKMRRLSTTYSESTFHPEPTLLLLLSSLGIFFSFVLMVSFCVDKNECCDPDSREEMGFCCVWCWCYDPNCRCRHHRDSNYESGLLVCLVLLLVFVIVYFSVKACGKHISRCIAIIAEFLFSFACVILASIYAQTGPSDLVGSIITISSILTIMNFLGLLLPNLACCISLTYGYKPGPTNVGEPVNQPFYEPDPSPTPAPMTTGTAVPPPPAPYYAPPPPMYSQQPATPNYIPPSGYNGNI